MAAVVARRKTRGTKIKRQTSNVFAMFEQAQITEFKAAFDLIDVDKDQFINGEDLRETYSSLGKLVTDEFVHGMMNQSDSDSKLGDGSRINFTVFLSMFGEKLQGTDSENVIRNAFACLDDEGSGLIHEDFLREALTTMGSRYSNDKVDAVLQHAPIDDRGFLNYNEFVKVLKSGSKDNNDL